MTRKQSVSLNVSLLYKYKLHSEVKIFIPKKEINGKIKPCVSKGCIWYVYFSFRNPLTNKLERHIYKSGINRLKTATERYRAANDLKSVLKQLLIEGFNPYEKFNDKINLLDSQQQITVLMAVNKAYNSKAKEWKESTRDSENSHYQVFFGG